MSTNKSDYGCRTMRPYEKTTKFTIILEYTAFTDMQSIFSDAVILWMSLVGTFMWPDLHIFRQHCKFENRFSAICSKSYCTTIPTSNV